METLAPSPPPLKKRFTFKSYEQSLKSVHLPSPTAQTAFDEDLPISDNSSHFRTNLEQLQQLSLAPSFVVYADHVYSLSESLPLLLHNWKDVTKSWLVASRAAGEAKDDGEGYKPLLQLLKALAHDLRTTMMPMYLPLIKELLPLLLRKLNPAASEELLATLLAMFKYILIPSLPSVMLRDTWRQLRRPFIESSNDGRRMLGEVWGAVIRRLPSDERTKLVSMMLYSLLEEPELRDGITWAFVAACQSASRSLHQCTSALLSDCIDVHLTTEDPSETGTILRRILTSFSHHVPGPEQYHPVSGVIVERLQAIPSSLESDVSSSEHLKRMFALAQTPCIVRNGSRMKQEQISMILAVLTNLDISTLKKVEGEYGSLLFSALVGCEMMVWMGNGRKAVERAWEIESLGLRIAGSLSDVDWGGWTAIMLPSVINHLPVALTSDGPNSASALRLLASLHEAGRLQSVPKQWFLRIAEWVNITLTKWQYSEDQIIQLVHILSLLPVLPIAEIDLVPSIARIVNDMLKYSPETSGFSSTPRNIAAALAECLLALSRLPPAQREVNIIEYSSWLDVLTLEWSSNAAVMDALLMLSIASPRKAFGSISDEALRMRFDTAIMSHDRRLRLSALRMINAHSGIHGESATPPSTVRACLLAEEVALDVAGVRNRVLKTGKVTSSILERDVLLATRWLLAQLKINLRPLWAPAAEAISSLLDRFPDTVWPLVFTELQKASRQDHAELGSGVPEWLSNFNSPGEEQAFYHEAEKSWRCPTGHRLRDIIWKWQKPPIEAATIYLIQMQRPQDRLDLRNYEIQVLEAISKSPASTAKNSRVFVPFFLALASEQLPRPRLKAYLTLISKLNNPKALYSTSSLHAIHYSLLSSPDRTLQLLALDCVMAYKSPALLRHELRLRTIVDEMKWRDELAFLNIQEEVEDAHRKELMDALIRLLYGIMADHKGRNRGADRRGAVLSAITPCSGEELDTLVQLMLEPFGVKIPLAPLSRDFSFNGIGQASVGQQAGYLHLLGDVLRHLGPQLIKHWPALLSTTLEILNIVQGKITNELKSDDGNKPIVSADTDLELIDDDDGTERLDDPTPREPHKTSRPLRQIGLRRLADFFKAPVTTFDFVPYMKAAFSSFISPRLANLERENTQAPSALLELLATWTASPQTVVFLVDYDSRTLPKLYQCLSSVNVKAAVVSKVLDVIEHVLILSSDDERVASTVLRPHNATLLEQLCLMFERISRSQLKADQLAQRYIGILSSLSGYIQDKDQASRLLSLLSPLLRKPTRLVPENIKTDLLQVTRHLMHLVPECQDPSCMLYQQTYEMLAGLFQTLRGRQARAELLVVFEQLTSVDPSLRPLVDVLINLSSFSIKRLDEPDFERRLDAFTRLNETLYHTLSTRGWLVVTFIMLFHIQDPEELAVRNNAAFSLRRFVDTVSASKEKEDALDWKSLEVVLTHILYPALRNGLRSRFELVRSEIVGVIARAIDKCGTIPVFQEMRPLLADGDAEANFFNNVYHIQAHRRTRALRRLSQYCRDGRIRSSTISELFIPLVGHFVANTGVDHHVVNETIITIGHLAGSLTWSAYNALVQQHLKETKEKNGQEKIHVRTLVSILDCFHFQLDDIADDGVEPVGNADDQEEPPAAGDISPALTPSMRMKITDAVSQRLLPALLQFMEKRDEAEDNLRIPISVGIVRVAQHLPESTRTPQIEKLITILSQALRSKSQETRDMVRETMCKIAVMLGPQMLPTIIKELRAALARGPQLHVLAFVTYTVMAHITSSEHVGTFGNLDDTVDGVAHIAAEVIFGQSGRDVQSEDFRTKMREVRGSATRGLDTFAIMAKYISPPKISGLLRPIRAIMHETEALKVMQKVDDVLRRVASGLNSNAHLTPPQLLVLCHTFLSQNAKFLRQESGRPAKRRKTDFDVQMKGTDTSSEDCYANNSHKFVAFGLDLFVTAFRRSLFDFNDRDVISRLEPMVGVIGNTLYSIDAHVVVLGLRAAAAIVRCPVSSISKSLPVYQRQMLAIIRQAGTTESDVVQNAFKSLATIIRDCPEASVQASDLTYLLEVLAPDLEEKDRQVAVFALLRAIVSRKFVVPEIYDIMDKVAEIMVTNQSTEVQELCRGVYLQFLLDYPQGKGRLRTQMTFLAKNLSYVFHSGRQSVMELLSAIFSKFESRLVYEYSDLFFVALFMVIANDDSTKCRTMAGELIKALFIRLDEHHREIVMDHLRTWACQKSQSSLLRTVAQVYGLLVDVLDPDAQVHMTFITNVLNDILETSAATLRGLELPDDDVQNVDTHEIEWQLPYQSLSSLLKIVRISSDLVRAPGRIRWDCISAHSLFPHTWVRLASSRLIGFLFNAFPIGPPSPDLPASHPLSRDGFMDVARKLCIQLCSPNIDDTLSLQLVKNLFYVGKCFHTWPRLQSTLPQFMEESDEEGDEVHLTTTRKNYDNEAEGNPLPWLFSKLSYQARSAHIARRNRTSTELKDSWVYHILSIFRWFAAMTNHMPSDDVESFLTHILSPVYRILEDDTIRDARMDELKTLAQELQTLVQEKMGPTKFSATYNKIRQRVLSVRRERKSARAIQATSDPVQAARRKTQRNIAKKGSRKRKNQEFTNEKIKQGLKRPRFE